VPYLRIELLFYYVRDKNIFIVGKPIHVVQINYPTSNDIDQLHNDYLLAVEQLFVENKDKYGLEHVKLEII
jgi:hypothetical protein